MKKGVVISLFILLLSSILFFPLISATEEESALGGYACLESIVDQRGCNDFSTEERAFLVMAGDYCGDEVISDMNSANSCWPSNTCNVKDTAQAVFVLYEKREDVETSKDWLTSQTISAQGLEWFLEVETSNPTNCIARYKGENYNFALDHNRRISGDVGSCLSITPEGFWFEISSSCFDEEFEIICGEDFLTTLLFKKDDSNTINVLSTSEYASANGKTTQEVSARCFTSGNGGGCNYEASLWATFALWASGEDVSGFVPYLTAMKNDNEIYLPEAFLYFLTGKFGIELLDKQIQFSYWSESGDSYYDTALALLPMRYESSDQKQNAKDWLMTTQIKSGENQGCWDGGDVRNTAFILRSVWPEYSPSHVDPEVECEDNQDCPQGELCNSENECYDPSDPECETNEDCTVEGEICSDGYCIDPDDPLVCGDGIREASEECDGYEYGGQTCEALGFGSGNLHCNSDCTIDKSDCSSSPECTTNLQCGSGKICQNGNCVNKPDTICTSDIDCDSGKICQNGNCVNKPETECTFDFQCGPGEICKNNECVPEPIDPPENVTCTFDWQCEELYGEGWFCENETCFANPGKNITECDFDFQCKDDEICEGGDCILINATNCTNDWDCPGADICVNGSCQEEEEDCIFDFECEELYGIGWICEAGFCIVPEEKENETCESDFDCSDWTQICIDGLCVDNQNYDCLEEDYACMFDSQCQGQILELYSPSCGYPFICCDNLPLETCFEKNGEICFEGEVCVRGQEINSSGLYEGETCCLGGSCVKSSGETCDSDLSCQVDEECIDGFCVKKEEMYNCEANKGHCRTFECEEDEEISIVYSCEYGDSCCIPKIKEKKKNGIWLIIILLVFVSLIVLGILFRDKLKNYWVEVKSKFDKGTKKPMQGRRPGMPPYPPKYPPRKPIKKKKSFKDKVKGIFSRKKKKQTQNRMIPRNQLRRKFPPQYSQRKNKR